MLSGPELVDSQRVRILSEPSVGSSIVESREFLTAKPIPSSRLTSDGFPCQKNDASLLKIRYLLVWSPVELLCLCLVDEVLHR